MKNILIIFAFGLGLTSCETTHNNYNCECKCGTGTCMVSTSDTICANPDVDSVNIITEEVEEGN